MCGIFGFAGHPPAGAKLMFDAFLTELAIETQVRGSHATGLCAYVGDRRTFHGKGPITATEFVRVPLWARALKQAHSLIGHTRFATQGNPADNKNNHPFLSERWAMIHNGVISGYMNIAHKEGVKLESDCDSEVILRVIDKNAKHGNALRGLKAWVNAQRSYMTRYAVALMDRSNGKIRLLRDDAQPCHIMRIPKMNIVAFASTEDILTKALNFALMTVGEDEGREVLAGIEGWSCAPLKVYVLNPDTLEVEHEEIPRPTYRGGSSSGGISYGGGACDWKSQNWKQSGFGDGGFGTGGTHTLY